MSDPNSPTANGDLVDNHATPTTPNAAHRIALYVVIGASAG